MANSIYFETSNLNGTVVTKKMKSVNSFCIHYSSEAVEIALTT